MDFAFAMNRACRRRARYLVREIIPFTTLLHAALEAEDWGALHAHATHGAATSRTTSLYRVEAAMRVSSHKSQHIRARRFVVVRIFILDVRACLCVCVDHRNDVTTDRRHARR